MARRKSAIHSIGLWLVGLVASSPNETWAHDSIPVIDLARLSAANATAESKRALSREWGHALETYGFASVVGHGVPTEVEHDIFDAAQRFFALDASKKLRCREKLTYGAGGYTPMGVESVSRSLMVENDGTTPAAPPDLVENFVFLPPVVQPESMGPAKQACLDALESSLEEAARLYWMHMVELVRRLHELSALALGLDDAAYFERFYDAPSDPELAGASFALRLAHYPPLEPPSGAPDGELCKVATALEETTAVSARNGSVRYGAHTDYQGFTVLRPDPSQPGLEVLSSVQIM